MKTLIALYSINIFWCLFFAALNDVFVISAYSQQQLPPTPLPLLPISLPTTPAPNTVKRRGFFAKTIYTAATAMFTVATTITTPCEVADATGTEVLSSKFCAYGEGNDCDDLAEGNPYILELQRKSAANKKNNVESAKNAFYAKNYPGWFEAVGETMIQKESDGTFIVVDDTELAKLKAENKISVLQTPKTMGGRIVDVTQKPMLVLKE